MKETEKKARQERAAVEKNKTYTAVFNMALLGSAVRADVSGGCERNRVIYADTVATAAAEAAENFMLKRR